MVYPAFGVVYAKGIQGFSAIEASDRRHQGDRNALWCVPTEKAERVGADLAYLQDVHHRYPLHDRYWLPELLVLCRRCQIDFEAAQPQFQGYP
jgi:hypothetical protein